MKSSKTSSIFVITIAYLMIYCLGITINRLTLDDHHAYTEFHIIPAIIIGAVYCLLIQYLKVYGYSVVRVNMFLFALMIFSGAFSVIRDGYIDDNLFDVVYTITGMFIPVVIAIGEEIVMPVFTQGSAAFIFFVVINISIVCYLQLIDIIMRKAFR